jgi:cell division septation protein DedD
MRKRRVDGAGVVVALAVVVLAAVVAGQTQSASGGATSKAGPAPKTAWGEPDLQGIWSDEYQIPLERPAQYANKPFFTDAERAQLDKQLAASDHFGDRTQPRGTEADVGGAYNSVFTSQRHVGNRTSLIIDPSNGRIPALTPEASKRRNETRDFQTALQETTKACLDKVPGACGPGGSYKASTPKRSAAAPHYLVAAINRSDNPEDRGLGERCMSGNLPEFAGGFVGVYRRIVQGPGVVYVYYDSGQGQGWSRVIPITTAPHLPASIRQWWGDSRGHWEGNTLVVDTTNFNAKKDFQGSRENLHLVERWTRTGPGSLELVSTLEDPTTWTRPWTVKQEFNVQSNEANRIYTEPRCHEGNYGLVGLLAGGRAADTAYAEGRGPDPALLCTSGCGNFDEDSEPDPLGSTARIRKK